jgi:hypothetical protein
MCQHPIGQRTLESIRARLQDMGVGDDVAISGADAVDYLNELLERNEEALESHQMEPQ